ETWVNFMSTLRAKPNGPPHGGGRHRVRANGPRRRQPEKSNEQSERWTKPSARASYRAKGRQARKKPSKTLTRAAKKTTIYDRCAMFSVLRKHAAAETCFRRSAESMAPARDAFSLRRRQ